jgi:hypothetical protein
LEAQEKARYHRCQQFLIAALHRLSMACFMATMQLCWLTDRHVCPIYYWPSVEET